MWLDAMDTALAITACFISALLSQHPIFNFVAYCHPSVISASTAQATIGWLNLTDGKIATGWRVLQKQHYRNISSHRLVHSWARGVVQQLLLIAHHQWSFRNSILHKRDTRGRLIRKTQELFAVVEAQFALGLEGLHPDDHHFLSRGREAVLALHQLSDARAWLSGLRVVRPHYICR
jgi:hypothetical protein